jgi:photosystem II stability/assembly factor-like uncharacterized protein
MKNLLLFLIVLYSINYSQGWVRHDFGIPEDINSIHFVDSEAGYLAGTLGAIYKTSDGGSKWNKLNSGQTETINCITSNGLKIWAVGNNGLLLYSSDNGATWTKLQLGTSLRLNSISFSNTIGLISADGGKIFRTTDGGDSWNIISLENSVLRAITIIGDRCVVVGGDVSPYETRFIANSSDAGLNWQISTNGVGYALTAVQSIDYNLFCAVGIKGSAIKSTDGGVTWYGMNVNTNQWLYGLHFEDETNGSICGGNVNKGIILKTTDGGISFTSEIPMESKWLHSIYTFKNESGFCAGATGGRLYKYNSAPFWVQQDTKTSSLLNDVSFYDDNIGVAVGDLGVVTKTSNGGNDWELSPVLTLNDLNSVDRFLEILVVVGDSGVILRSSDNGAQWNRITALNYSDLLAVDLVNGTTGYAGGENGFLTKTTDGGLTWSTLQSPTTLTIRGISFISESVGYIAGGVFISGSDNIGMLYRTSNGGVSWESVYTDIPLLTGITTSGTQKIYAFGVKGFALYSLNGGLWWNLLPLNTNQWLYSADFVNDKFGFIVGGNVYTGMIWMTTDAGITWFNSPVSGVQWLYGVEVLPSGKVFLCGFNGKMLRGNLGYLPVELTSFLGEVINSHEVELTWITQTETNNMDFDIERNIGDGWEKVGFKQGAGTTTLPQTYSFKDRDIKNNGNKSLKYRLKQNDYDGQFNYSNIIEIDLLVSESFVLLQNYPNPFNPETSISFSLPKSSNVKITLYDILGKIVAQITDEFYNSGFHKVQFNGTNLASGVYFYEMNADSFREVKVMNLLK